MLNKNSPAPIALFCFNRPHLLTQTLTALAANTLADQSHLTIFCDGPRTEEEKELTDAVRKIAHTTQGFASVTVIEREKNMGCAASVIDGLKTMFAKHESLIVMEDDILSSPHTLDFLNEGLTRYKENVSIFNIAAWTPPTIANCACDNYTYDVFAVPRFNCWGWASWRNRFENIDWDVKDYAQFKHDKNMRKAFNIGGEDLSDMLDLQMRGKINSWAIRADYARFKNNQAGINPVISYTTNIGMGSGTHTMCYADKYDNDVNKALPVEQICWPEEISVAHDILGFYRKIYSPPLWKTCLKKVLKSIGLFEIVITLKNHLKNNRT